MGLVAVPSAALRMTFDTVDQKLFVSGVATSLTHIHIPRGFMTSQKFVDFTVS